VQMKAAIARSRNTVSMGPLPSWEPIILPGGGHRTPIISAPQASAGICFTEKGDLNVWFIGP
jgi:hypothetical protein